MPLTVFDAGLGASRDATQEDIDIMQAKVNAFGRLINEITDIQRGLRTEIVQIHNRYAQRQQLSGDL